MSEKLTSVGVSAIMLKDGTIAWASPAYMTEDGKIVFRPSRDSGWLSPQLALRKIKEFDDEIEEISKRRKQTRELP